MDDLRLQDFRLAAPRCDAFRRPVPLTDLSTLVTKRAGGVLHLPLPFFWFDPPWHLVPVERCRDVARAISQCGITVGALHRELSQRDDCDASEFSLRMAPHRCDRAGWLHRDFSNVDIVELRLVPHRDVHGRYAYSYPQTLRWKNIDADTATQSNVSVDAMLFPPEWRSPQSAVMKVQQLRQLCEAAIFVSLDEQNIPELLDAVISARPEGIIVRTHGDPLSTIKQTRKRLDAIAAEERPLIWIDSQQALSIPDAIVCFAWGADGLSVDAWCNDFLMDGVADSSSQSAYAYGGYRPPDQVTRLATAARKHLESWIEGIRGHAHACGVSTLRELNVSHLSH